MDGDMKFIRIDIPSAKEFDSLTEKLSKDLVEKQRLMLNQVVLETLKENDLTLQDMSIGGLYRLNVQFIKGGMKGTEYLMEVYMISGENPILKRTIMIENHFVIGDE